MKQLSILMIMALTMAVCHGAYLSVPDEYATIQEAIDASVPGDTVLVGSGLYTGTGNRDIDFRGKDIVVRSRSNCWIDCESTPEDSHMGFKLISGESSQARLEGFVIVNAEYGIHIRDGSSPVIVDCRISDSVIGIVVSASSNPVVANCQITSNSFAGVSWGAHSRGAIINTLVTDNDGTGMGFGHVGQPQIVNCTVANNNGYGIDIDESETMIQNSIIYNNQSGNINETISIPVISYCLIGGGYSGEGNIDTDPLFVSGSYHLSQQGSGQSETSPCINSGQGFPSDVCYETWSEQLCLDEFTTRTDGEPDTGIVDIGFHYRTDSVPPATPTPTLTPSPTPTSVPDGIRVELNLPDNPIMPGSLFFVELIIENTNDNVLTDIPLFCLLDIAGEFWFYPSWTMQPEWEILTAIPGGFSGRNIIPSFTWPDNVGSGQMKIWSALVSQDMTRILGEFDMKNISWS